MMLSLESDKITAFWPMRVKLSLFMPYSHVVIPNRPTFVTQAFDTMFSLKSDDMTALWPNDS